LKKEVRKEENEGLPVEPLTISKEKAAKMLGVCPRTVQTLTKNGELAFVRIFGRVLYPLEGLREFVQRRTQRESNGGKTDSL
jgi:excisionase family DNA binding protein